MSTVADTMEIAAPRGDEERSPTSPPFSYRQLESCRCSGCRCQGRGVIAVFAGHSAACIHEQADTLLARRPCLYAARRSRPEPDSVASRLFYLKTLLCSLPATTGTCGAAATVLFDLPQLDTSLLQWEPRAQDQHLLLLHQPAALSEFEIYLGNALPADLERLQPGLVGRPGVLLLVQESGWALGAFLAKAALLMQRRRWREAPSDSSKTTPLEQAEPTK